MRHKNVTLRLAVSLLDRFSSTDLEKLLKLWPLLGDLKEPNYSDVTLGQIEAMLNLVQKHGHDVRARWLAGELKMMFVEVVRDFFNRHGFFDTRNVTASHTDPNRDFKLTAPKGGWVKYDFTQLDLPARVARLTQFVPADSGLILPTADEVRGFLAHCEAIRNRVRDDKSVANVLNGPNLPTFVPQFKVENLGTFVEFLFTIAKRSYEDEFPGRIFCNHCTGDLADKVSVVKASRFRQVINKMTGAHVPGLEFFTPFQGFSIPADHEAIALLPKEFILSALDTIMSWALYPDILLSSCSTPGYDLAGLFWGSSLCSLYGKASAISASFHDGGLSASDVCSAGLFLPR